MNKYLIIGALIVFIGSVIYFTRTDDNPYVTPSSQNQPVLSHQQTQKIDAPANTQTNETTVRSVARSSSAKQISESLIITEQPQVEQTQNAVDFNAPGAGTAQQKANSANAATKAYEEAKQRGQ